MRFEAGRPKLGLIWAMSEIPTQDLLNVLYRVSDALPPRETGPS